MSNELQIQISSVQDFLTNLDLNPIETPQPLFRGEPGILSTACTPSLFRIGRKRNVDAAEQFDGYLYEKKRVNEWYNEVTLLESQKPLNLTHEIEKLILAQHYGIKTRLLDWTTNPLIALWFACREHDKTDNLECMYAVYECIPENLFLEDDGSDEFLEHNPDRKLAFHNPYCLSFPEYIGIKLKAYEQIHFIQPVKHLDVRIYKQSSVLSIHPNSQKVITPFKTYVIKKEVASSIMHELNILGINFHTTGLATRDSLAKNVNHSLDIM